MVPRHVQAFEIVVLLLDFGEIENLESHAHENLLDFRLKLLDWVSISEGKRESRSGNINLLLLRRQLVHFCGGLLFLKFLFHESSQIVHCLSKDRPFLFRKATELFQLGRNHPAFPGKIFIPHGFPAFHAGDFGKIVFEKLPQFIDGFIHTGLVFELRIADSRISEQIAGKAGCLY